MITNGEIVAVGHKDSEVDEVIVKTDEGLLIVISSLLFSKSFENMGRAQVRISGAQSTFR